MQILKRIVSMASSRGHAREGIPYRPGISLSGRIAAVLNYVLKELVGVCIAVRIGHRLAKLAQGIDGVGVLGAGVATLDFICFPCEFFCLTVATLLIQTSCEVGLEDQAVDIFRPTDANLNLQGFPLQ